MLIFFIMFYAFLLQNKQTSSKPLVDESVVGMLAPLGLESVAFEAADVVAVLGQISAEDVDGVGVVEMIKLRSV